MLQPRSAVNVTAKKCGMEAQCIAMKSSLEPPRLLRKPLPPKILPALDVKRPITSKQKGCIADWPAPTPASSRVNSSEGPVQWDRPKRITRTHEENNTLYDLSQEEEPRNSGPADFPTKKHQWRPPVQVHPPFRDDPRFQPPPPEFTLNDLLARSYPKDVSGTPHKPVLSRQHYSNLELFIASLRNKKQSKVHNVELPLWDLPEKSKRKPWQQQVLEQQQEMLRPGGMTSRENIGMEDEGSQYMDFCTVHDNKVLVTQCDLALLECLVHGGYSLSLKAFFLSKLPDLSPLYNTLLYLNLSFNELQRFPIEVFKLENLEVLKLRNNPITEIPPGIHNLKKLRTFIMSFCLLSSLPAGLFVLPCLQMLDISYNGISSIPMEICNLRALEFLNVEGNNLPALPGGALKLHLKYLRVGNNAMHPLFWRENTYIEPQKLTDLAALTYTKNHVVKFTADVPEEAVQILKNFKVCGICKGPLYGQGLRFIRPCEKIFGIRKLPFMFQSCSISCCTNFMKQTESLAEHLFES
uniref:Leucine-rich repeat-containing protein 63 n=1 Tax=Leptobrachium leishanense TaxID=445787 RepID=A0A8C5QLS4_9ANUR